MRGEVQPAHRILVVDDEPSVLNMFKSLLEFDGHEVQAVDSAEAALLALEKDRFDVVITDYAMPGMGGDELAAHVKDRWPDQPIIMASGSYAKCSVISEGNLRVDYFLCKPFLMDELREAIELVLSLRRETPLIDLATHSISNGAPPRS